MTQLEILTAGLYTAITEGRKSTAPTQDPNALATATTQANAIYNYLGGGSGTYATQQWVVAQGYITAAALTPYLTIAAAATLYQPLNAYLTDISAITGQTTNQVIGWNGTHWVAQTNGSGTVSSVSAGTGMNFTTITTSGSVSIDTTKVPYLVSGFGVSAGLLKWSGSAWSIDTSTYITSGTGAGGNLGGTYPNPNVIGILGANFPTLPTSGSYQLQASITAGTVTSWSFVAPSSGSVTTVSVATANGFAGTVANPTTTPAITIKTTITGILKGNATAISAAVSGTDYAPATSGSAILYGNGAGGFSNVTIGSGLIFSAGTLSASGGGTVTSVAMTVPTGLSISGSPITTSGSFALTIQSGYVIPTTTEETNWNTAYTNRITSLTTTGSSGAATLLSNTLNIPNYTIDGILPSQTGNSGKYLTTNGTSANWATVSASAAGSNQQLQVNVSGALGAYSNLITDGTTLFQTNAFTSTYNNANCAAVFGSYVGTTSGAIRIGQSGYISSGYTGNTYNGLQFMSTNGTFWFFNNGFGAGSGVYTYNLDGSGTVSGNGANLTGIKTIYTFNLAAGIDHGASGSGSSFYWRIRTLNSGTQTERFTVDNGATANVNIINSNLNVGGASSITPSSTLQISGSVAFKYVAKTANYTLTATDTVVLFNGTSLTATIPSASSATNRLYIIANRNATALTTSIAYLNLSGASTTTVLTMTSIMIISDGTNWQQIQ